MALLRRDATGDAASGRAIFMGGLNTVRLSATARGISAAAGILRRGGLAAFPTETVYGLGADARDERAVAGIYAAKGRPSHNPLIVHVESLAAAERLAVFPAEARALAERFWPGPLTLVLEKRPDSGLPEIVSAGGPRVGLRVPAHPVALDLLRAFGGPLAAPSANRSGEVSPTSADHVLEGLGGRIDAVIDGGPCPVGLESTIIGFSAQGARLLRPGGVALETIRALIGDVAADSVINDASPESPGQLTRHYAPRARLRLNAQAPRPGEGWLGFGGADHPAPALDLSAARSLEEAAANLFAHLRALDALTPDGGVIAVAPIPQEGLGRAINDRLKRAAAR